MPTNNSDYDWDPETHGVYEFKLHNIDDPRKIDDVKIMNIYTHADAAFYKLQGYDVVHLKHIKTEKEMINLRGAIAMASFF